MACVQCTRRAGNNERTRGRRRAQVALVVDRGTLVVSNAAWIAECANSSGRERGRERAVLLVHDTDAAGLHESLQRQEQRPATEQMSEEVRELWASLPRGTETCRALRNIGYG